MSEVVFEQKVELLDRYVGKVVADKYRIESEWRVSGLGKMYRAKHLLMDRPVTLKILSPALAVDVKIVNRFSAEARTISQLSHPNILNVTDFGTTPEGSVYIVLEDGAGETIKNVIEGSQEFSVERAVNAVRGIAAALTAAHDKKILHKHLTSDSVLLVKADDQTESGKVLDFGAVKPSDDGMFAEELSREDLVYTAPELISGSKDADERSDIFSAGIVFYEMLAGEPPFVAENGEEMLARQSENPPLPLSAFRDDIPEGLETVLLRAISLDPDMRYQKASAFYDDLAPFAADGSVTEPVPATSAELAAANNNIWKTAFVVLAGISLLAVGMIYATYTKQTDPTTQLQTDANGLPVQPLNPATGINEQNLIFSPDGTLPEIVGTNPGAEVAPGGDGYDPWARGGAPPPGAPTYPSGGQIITIPGDGSGSQFMPGLDASGGIILIPVPVNSNTAPAATPKPGKSPPANTADPATKDPETKPETKPTVPKTEKTPAPKPAETKEKPPASSGDKTGKSGKEQDAL